MTFKEYRLKKDLSTYRIDACDSANEVQGQLRELGLENIRVIPADNILEGRHGLIIYGIAEDTPSVKKWMEKNGDDVDKLCGELVIKYTRKYEKDACKIKHESMDSLEKAFQHFWDLDIPIQLYEEPDTMRTGFIVERRSSREWNYYQDQ